MKHLNIAEGLRLPIGAVEDVVAILGRRGRGKTTTAVAIVEELHAADARFCVGDPTGVWWGLKSSRDGKRPGIPVVVMGGQHGDVPLAAESGALIADFVVDRTNPSCVLDLSHFSHADMVRFATAFLARLYHQNAHVLHLVLDEADQFAPQRPSEREFEMLGAAQRITKMGRVKGLHPLLITQRPATLSKNVLTQAGTLIAHAITGPQDRDAVDEWIKANASDDERREFLATLPTLPRGTAYFWNPDLPMFRKVAVRDRQTFDSSGTPSQGQARAQPKTLAEVDLEALKARIADTIERAKADDPKELRRQIAELKKAAAAKPAPVATLAPPKVVERAVLKDAHVARLVAAVERARDMAATLLKRHAQQVDILSQRLQVVVAEAGTPRDQIRVATAAPQDSHHARTSAPVVPGRGGNGLAPVRRPPAPVVPRAVHTAGDAGLTPVKQRILDGLAFMEAIGGSGDKVQLALLCDVSPTSGSYFNNLGALRTAGLITYPSPGRIALSDEGRALARTDGVPNSAEELHEALSRKLPPIKWKIVEALIAEYPRSLSKEGLAERIGVSATSGSYFNNLGSLRSLGLIDYPFPGQVVARSVLFLEGAA